MARKLRIQYPGAIYPVMNRGDHQERIFADDQDRLLFLTTLAEACLKTGWQIHALCLMSNHFHLVVETPSANLVEGMKWFLGVKVELAARLRAETTVTLEWIAGRLGMGTRGHLAQLLQERTRPERPSPDQSLLGL